MNFKFGVLYAKAGQMSDDEMFSNGMRNAPLESRERLISAISLDAEKGSKEFERFLTILGSKIRLKGWDKYRGGLDVKGRARRSID